MDRRQRGQRRLVAGHSSAPVRNLRHPSSAWPLLAAAGLVVLAACGGGSSSSASKNGATTTSSAGAAPTVKATKGGDFCKQIASTYNEAANFSKNPSATPDELRQELDKSLKDGQDAIDNAPTEVKSDLLVIQGAVKTFADALAKVGYDAAGLGADALGAVSGFSTPAFQQAAAHSQAYVNEHCGIDLGATTTTP